jgi:transposase
MEVHHKPFQYSGSRLPGTAGSQQFGISDYSVYRWGKLYRLQGEAGLMHPRSRKHGSKLPAAVTQNIIDLKKENPARGARCISDILKRFFLMGASPSTVQRTLRDQGLTRPVKRKPNQQPKL